MYMLLSLNMCLWNVLIGNKRATLKAYTVGKKYAEKLVYLLVVSGSYYLSITSVVININHSITLTDK